MKLEKVKKDATFEYLAPPGDFKVTLSSPATNGWNATATVKACNAQVAQLACEKFKCSKSDPGGGAVTASFTVALCGGPQPCSPSKCNDGNACTDDACTTDGNCQSKPTADGSPCGTDKTCKAGVCMAQGGGGAHFCDKNCGGKGNGCYCDTDCKTYDDCCNADGSGKAGNACTGSTCVKCN